MSVPRVAPGLTDDEFSAVSPAGQSLLRIESRLTRYREGPGAGERKCISCMRKRYGGPSCCNEGWDRWRDGKDSGGCVNWTGPWDEGMAGPEGDES